MTLPVPRSSSPLGRWDPMREFDDLHERMNRLMASVFGDAGTARWTPPVDVRETDDAWLVEVDVPGLKRDDITIEASGTELAISGEYQEKERTRSRTRRVGEFEYRTSLPANIDTEKISADLNDGVLTVKIPKSEVTKPRRIAITGT